MGNKGIAAIAAGASGAFPMSPADAACKAFAAAVKAFDGRSDDATAPTFTEFFLAALEKTKPVGAALAESVAGDLAVAAARPSRSIAAAVGRTSGSAAAPARRILLRDATRRARGEAGPSAAAWSKLAARWLDAEPGRAPPRFPQGTLHHEPIVVKAPGDSYEPGKLEEFQQRTPERRVAEVGCECCGEDCGDA